MAGRFIIRCTNCAHTSGLGFKLLLELRYVPLGELGIDERADFCVDIVNLPLQILTNVSLALQFFPDIIRKNLVKHMD